MKSVLGAQLRLTCLSLHRLQGVRNKDVGFGRVFRRLQSGTRGSACVSCSSAGAAGDADAG